MQYQDFVPMSYQPDFSVSDLSLETGKRSNERHNGSPMRSKLPLSPKSTIATQRQSQICGVPLLETQLIPSLRDTINRMTRPPNVATSSYSPGPSGRDDKKEDSLKTNLRTPNFQSNSPLPPNTMSVKNAEMTESHSRLAAKTLKSVLRSPKTPKTPAAAAVSSPSQNSPALRSMRSILGKKLKTPPPASSKPRGISSKDVFVCSSDKLLQVNSRSRSCTDPGQPLDSFSRQQQSTFHHVTSSEDRDSITQPDTTTLKSRNKIPKSSIPRPANIRRRAQTAQSEPVTEESDIELRYEMENRDRRRLTVANAEVYPSSSSSASVLGSSTESVHHVPQSPVTPKQYSTLRRETKWSYKGLGLALDPQRDPIDEEPPTTSVGPNNNDVETDSGLRSFSHKQPQSNFVLENARRRAALLKLVAKLDSEQKTVSGRDYQVDNDGSDYAVEEGVALSGSSVSVTNRNTIPDKDDDEASQYEDDYEVDDMYQPFVSVAHMTDMQSNAFDSNLARQQRTQSPGMALRGKSPSRSPVIRQSICEGSPAPFSPAVLKRRSIYIEAPDAILQDSASPKPGDGASPSENQADVDTASLVSSTANVIAARARLAFGIPQSESDKLYDSPEHRLNRVSLAESQFSSAGSDFWRATHEDDNSGGGNELSDGAASLFRDLSGGGKGREEHRDSACSGRRRASSASSAPAQHWDTVKSHELSPAPADAASGNPYPHSFYDGGHHSARQVDVSDNNPTEARRQKVLSEFCESEETFVARLHVCVQLFILPLRIRNSKSWVDGVPSDIAHFLDWFEDIANLHTRHIVHTLRNVQRAVEQNIIRCISEPLLTLIPRLEIYQPYLVRLGSVTNAVGRMIRQGDNDFGEFVAIQQRTPECGGWGLEEFLLEPMNRLTKYCDIFSRLLGCTPKDHPDYLPTFSLLQSIDVIVRVMTEVKVREDEYDFIKDLASNIRGFPPSLQLASRDRRLLCQAQLSLAPESEQDPSSTPKAGNQELRTPTKPTLKERAGNRMSRLASAVQAWDAIRGRSGSIKSTTSSCAGFSIRSDVSRDFSKGEHVPSCEVPTTSEPRKIVHLFILSDLVILATPISQDADKPALQLVNGIGLSQVFHAELQVEEEEGCSESIAVLLDLIPLNEELKMSSMRLTTVHTRLLLQSETQGQGDKRLSAQRQIEQWRSAFHQSSQSTLRSLSYPTVSDKMNYTKCQDPNHLMAPLLDAGLPVPKSPSIQVLDVKNGQQGDSMQQEREERGWWSVRFQQILQEMYKS